MRVRRKICDVGQWLSDFGGRQTKMRTDKGVCIKHVLFVPCFLMVTIFGMGYDGCWMKTELVFSFFSHRREKPAGAG